ncbi:Putative ribonuclease H protein At1g65750 [Linum perenne]
MNPSFGIAAWLIWKRRNKFIFDGISWSTAEVSNQAKFWELLLSSSWKAGQLGREAPGLARQTQLIGWRPADEGWFTLNSDGSLYLQNNRAAAGGLIRDCGGNYVSSYAINLGSCSIMRAELRGIIHVYREANNAADYLANLGHSLVLGSHVFQSPDNTLLYWLRYDLIGVSTPRTINNMS